MAIDNPFDQAMGQIEAERRDQSPALDGLRKVVPLLKLLGSVGAAITVKEPGSELIDIIDSILGALEQRSQENLIDLLVIVNDDIQGLRASLASFEAGRRDYLAGDWPLLIADGIRRALHIRAKSRIERIAKILSTAALSDPPPPPDRTQEFMRIAVELDDIDIRVLHFLAKGQALAFTSGFGRVNENAANIFWEHGEHRPNSILAKSFPAMKGPGTSGVGVKLNLPEGELQSVCAKLHSFGLMAPVPQDNINNFEGTSPYAMLRRGFDFLNSIQPGSITIPA